MLAILKSKMADTETMNIFILAITKQLIHVDPCAYFGMSKGYVIACFLFPMHSSDGKYIDVHRMQHIQHISFLTICHINRFVTLISQALMLQCLKISRKTMVESGQIISSFSDDFTIRIQNQLNTHNGP